MDDTICAISTPIGEAGIGIVRLSGEKSLSIARRIFKTKKRLTSHRLIYGKIIDPEKNSIIDEVLLCYMKAPKTYTKEDIIEINIHSSFAVLSEVLSLVLKEGARLAQPGEFTKRAFLNGRIDLVQAEAVAKIVSSKTDFARLVSERELDGHLSSKIRDIKENLLMIISELEAGLDFEEELELEHPSTRSQEEERRDQESEIRTPEHQQKEGHQSTKEKIRGGILSVKKELKALLNGYKVGRLLNSAIGVIVGRPNVGKSSILNGIIGRPAAIVTEIPGTTRDLISEIINISGIPLKIVDTAGLCKTIDLIEKEGVKRALKAIDVADIVIYVLDGSSFITEDDIRILEKIKDKNVIFAINKVDLPQRIEVSFLKKYKKPIVFICAKNKKLSSLLEAIKGILFKSYDESHIITSVRHKDLIERSLKFLDCAIKSWNLGDEIISLELRDSINAIAEILGENIRDEDILDRIFSTFCIGK